MHNAYWTKKGRLKFVQLYSRCTRYHKFNLLADDIIGLASANEEEAFILFKNSLTIAFITDILDNNILNSTKLCNPWHTFIRGL